MSAPGNTARKLRVEEMFGPDLLSDPSFEPCRDESCARKDLHAVHEVVRVGRKIHTGYDKCPLCQTPVVVTKTRRARNGKKRTREVTRADCPACGWTHTKALKKGSNV